MLFKTIIFGVSIMLVLFAMIVAIILLLLGSYSYGPDVIRWLRSRNWREVVEVSREKIRRLRRIERVDRMWKWFEHRNARGEADAFVTEELEHLGSYDGEGREGSVGGETLFEGEGDEHGDGQAKKEEMELDL